MGISTTVVLSLRGWVRRWKGKALNVNLEFHNYRMWTWDEINEYMKTRGGDNWDMIRRFVDVDGD